MKRNIPTRHILLTAVTAAAMSFPLLAGAATQSAQEPRETIFWERGAQTQNSAERLYERLKAASRRMCGSSNLYLTGSVRRSAGIDECYEGTLEAAVGRLDDPQVSELHRQEFASL